MQPRRLFRHHPLLGLGAVQARKARGFVPVRGRAAIVMISRAEVRHSVGFPMFRWGHTHAHPVGTLEIFNGKFRTATSCQLNQ